MGFAVHPGLVDHQEREACPAREECREKLVLQAPEALVVAVATMDLQGPLESVAARAHRENRDLEGLRAQRGLKVGPVEQASGALGAHKAPKVIKALLDPRETQVPEAIRVLGAGWGKVGLKE